MIYKCPKCNGKLGKTRKGFNLRCMNHWCGYLSEAMSKEDVLKIINNKPTALDLLIEEIEDSSNYSDDLDEKYILKDDAIDIIKKYHQLFVNN
jgi:hypothetical protein